MIEFDSAVRVERKSSGFQGHEGKIVPGPWSVGRPFAWVQFNNDDEPFLFRREDLTVLNTDPTKCDCGKGLWCPLWDKPEYREQHRQALLAEVSRLTNAIDDATIRIDQIIDNTRKVLAR